MSRRVKIEDFVGVGLYSENERVIQAKEEQERRQKLSKRLYCFTAISFFLFYIFAGIGSELYSNKRVDDAIFFGISTGFVLIIIILWIFAVKARKDSECAEYELSCLWLESEERETQIKNIYKEKEQKRKEIQRRNAKKLVECWNILDDDKTKEEKIKLLTKYMEDKE